jgi:peptide/nickel transport system substrate-binding protein
MAVEPQHGGTLNCSFNADPRSLDPHMTTTHAASIIQCNIYNTLVRWNKEMNKLEPDLAESYSRPDDLTYVFKLRKGIRFHNIPPVNGRELTSEDIKYSIERAAGMHGKKSLFMNRSRFEDKFASIDTPDKYTVIFKTKEPYAALINYLSGFSSSIVPKEAVEEFGDVKRNAIGTGPFMLKDYVRGSYVHLVKNPNYFKKGLPYLDEVRIKIMPDAGSVTSALLAGDLDVTQVWFFQISTIEEKAPDTTILKQKGHPLVVLRVSPWSDDIPIKAPFDNIKVRRAIGHAIDKQRLINVALDGYGTPQIGSVPNWPPYSLPEKDQVEYNPEKSKKLLAEAGHPNGFSAELITWNAPYMTKPAQVIQSMLKEVGIDLKLKPLEFAQYFNRVYKYDYEMSLHMMIAVDDPEHGLAPTFGRNSTYYKWNNKEIWRMIDEQGKIMDPEKRAAMIRDTQRKIMEDAPQVFLMTQNRFTVFQPWVFPKDAYFNLFQTYLFEETWMAKK